MAHAYDLGADELLTPADREDLKRIKEHFSDDLSAWTMKHESTKTDYKAMCKSSDDSPILMFRGQITINAPPETVARSMTPPAADFAKVMKEIDPMVIAPEVLENTDVKHLTIYANFTTPPIVTNRDVVWTEMRTKISDDEFVMVVNNAEHPSKPPEPESLMMSHVRAHIFVSGWYFRRTPDNKCHTVYVAHLDPKGWLPALIVNQISLDQCANVKRCKARVEGSPVEA